MKLEQGRPFDCTGRLEKEIKTYDLLDSLGIQYDRVDHEPAFTMEVCEEIDKVLGAMICKNLFLCNRQKTDFYLLLIPGDKVFKTKEITSQLGCSRLSFAYGESMEKYLNLTPGSASIMGLMFDPEQKVRFVVDEDVLKAEYFGCHPCINTSSIRIRTADVFGKLTDALNHEMTVVKLLGETE